MPRWAEVFTHPLVPAPGATLERGPTIDDPAVILSALRRTDHGVQLRVYTCGTQPRPDSPAAFAISDATVEL